MEKRNTEIRENQDPEITGNRDPEISETGRIKTKQKLDKDIREPLFAYLEERYGKVRIIEEKRMGRSRADVIMVTDGLLYGIEIKSDADSYTRLSGQITDYDLYFDCNLIVVGSTHAKHVAEHVPEWWGILSVEFPDGKADFYEVRPCRQNPKREMTRKLRFLWRPELAHIQEINGMYKYAGKSKDFVIDKISECVEHTLLDRQISEELFERDYTTIADRINAYRTEHGKHRRRRTKKRRRTSRV